MKILTDWKHWLGWFLTVVVLYGVFYFLPLSFMQTWWKIAGVTLLIIVAVDYFKHEINLQ